MQISYMMANIVAQKYNRIISVCIYANDSDKGISIILINIG